MSWPSRCLVAAILALAAPFDGFAQTVTGQVDSEPVPLFQVAPAASDDAGATTYSGDAPASVQGIQVQTLENLDTSAVGLVDEQTGGLPVTLWSNSHPDVPLLLVANLPEDIQSPALRALARRLLVTAAPLPSGSGGLRSEARTSAFLAERINKLIAMGATREAIALAETIPGTARDRAIDRSTAEAALSGGQLDEACRAADVSAAEDSEPFWQRLLVFCQIRAGDLAGAELSTQLLTDLGQASPLFLTLSDSLIAGLSPTLSDADAPDVLEAAMMAYLGIGSKSADDLATLEQQAATGRISPDLLAERYAAAEVTAVALDDPVKAAAETAGPEARALLYQSATIQSVPAAKVEIIRAAIESARRDGQTISIGPTFTALIDQVRPESSLWRFAEDAARLYYRLGDLEQARLWHGILRTRTLGDPEAAAATARLWPHGVIAGETTIDADQRGLSAAAMSWRSILLETRGDGAAQVTRALALMSALNHPVEAITLNHAFDDPAARPKSEPATITTDATIRSALASATRASRVGEVVALAVSAVGPRPAEALDTPSIAELVSALDRVGLTAEARALALEALP